MAYLGSFNATDIQPADFSALPAGDYTALISDSEFKTSKSGGQYLALTFQIVDGIHAGRYLWHNLNLMHDNPKAVEIAQRELSGICHATGKLQIQDSVELHNIPHRIKVAYVSAKGEYPEKNQIKKWEPLHSAGSAAVAAAAPPKAAPPAPAKAPPPTPPIAKSAPQPAKAPQTAKPAPQPAPAMNDTGNGNGIPPWKRAPAAPAPVAASAPVAKIAEDDISY